MPNPPRTPVESLFDGLAAALGVAVLEFGARALRAHATFPRAVFVPTGGPYEPPVQKVPGQRTVARAWSGWEAHLWAADVNAAREMERALLDALTARFPAALRPLANAWVDAGELADGEVVVVRFQVAEPLVAAPATTARPRTVAFESASAVPGDGALQAGER